MLRLSGIRACGDFFAAVLRSGVSRTSHRGTVFPVLLAGGEAVRVPLVVFLWNVIQCPFSALSKTEQDDHSGSQNLPRIYKEHSLCGSNDSSLSSVATRLPYMRVASESRWQFDSMLACQYQFPIGTDLGDIGFPADRFELWAECLIVARVSRPRPLHHHVVKQ